MPDSSERPLNFTAHAFERQGMRLTDEQVAIQSSRDVSLLVEAAAGAAKTTSLCLRICEALASGADPRRMLVLTFTGTARDALRRTLRLLGENQVPHDQVVVETFDRYAAEVLRRLERSPEAAGVRYLSSPEQAREPVWAAVAAAADAPRERFREDLQIPSYGNESYVGEFLAQTERLKGTMALSLNPPESGDSPDYAYEVAQIDYSFLRVFRRYEERRRDDGRGAAVFRMPYDATHDLAAKILESGDAAAGEIPFGVHDRVFVDEMHDCNQAMFLILQALLRRPAVRFCAVGDRHQVIHQRYGADARFMGRELDALLGRRVARLKLTLTFRYGSSVARWMARLTGKPIESFHGARTEVLAVVADGAAQERACVEALQAWRGQRRKLDDCAILLRRDAQSVLLENALHAAGVPYTCVGFTSYLRRPEVLFVRTVFAIASGQLDTLGGADTRALVPDALFELSRARVIDKDTDPDYRSAEDFLREARRNASASEAVVAAIFEQHVMRRAPEEVARRMERAVRTVRESGAGCAFEAFLEALDMRRFALEVYVSRERRSAVQEHMEGLLAAAAHFPTVSGFFRSLQLLDEANAQRLADRAEGKVYSNRRHVPAVTIARAAHVKGLEFGHVLLPYLRQGVFPSEGALPEDELNLFYVAATRARDRLTLVADAAEPSQYVPRPMIDNAAATTPT